MKIAIGNDQHGLTYKKMIMEAFPQHEFVDFGTNDATPVSYPLVAEKTARAVAAGQCERGILICGTGIGMAMCANKIRGCFAAVCHDIYSTQRSILSNDANMLCMGALVIGSKTMLTLTEEWLKLTFDPTSASAPKVNDMRQLEERF